MKFDTGWIRAKGGGVVNPKNNRAIGPPAAFGIPCYEGSILRSADGDWNFSGLRLALAKNWRGAKQFLRGKESKEVVTIKEATK